MTITYGLGTNPKWYIADLVGLPAGGAELHSYRQLNKTQRKPIYQESSGTLAWTNPILFDENGTEGPFFFEVDSTDPTETYYLEVYDAQGNLIWSQENYTPGTGGGGGGGTSVVNINNLITNGVFWNHVSNTTPVPASLAVAPSNHEQFSSPDILFIKNNTAATDSLTFVNFAAGDDPLTGDTTPAQYLQYDCNNNPAGETEKCLQFPIQAKVNTLDNQIVTFSVWAKGTSGTTTLSLYQYQFFGDGPAASSSAPVFVQTFNLTSSWARYTVTFSFDNSSGKTTGECGNDATYLRLRFPLSVSTSIQLTKPSLYLGSLFPAKDFQSYDQIASITDSERTGDLKTSIKAISPFGYIAMNDGSIGSVASNATTRNNIDTFFLYETLWNSIPNEWAPTQDSAGTPVARGASAGADFVLNKRLVLTKTLGRAIAKAGSGAGLTPRSLGENLGSENAVVVLHNHGGPGDSRYVTKDSGTNFLVGNEGGTLFSNPTTKDAGESGTGKNMQPTVFYNIFAKL